MFVEANNLPAFLGQIVLFSRLTDEQLALVVENTQQALFPSGRQIYELGNDADKFYIIQSGKVQLSRVIDGAVEYEAPYEAGDWFGEEALGITPLRQTSAVALEDTIVLAFDPETLRFLQTEIPLLRARLTRLQESFKLLFSAPIGWRQENETIFFLSRRHFFFLLTRLLPPMGLVFLALVTLVIWQLAFPAVLTPLLLAGLLFSAAAVWAVWAYIDWSNDYFIVTDRRVIYLEHIILLYDSRAEAPLDQILAVSNRTGFIGRILGFGNITVKSYTGIVRFEHIAYPQEIQVYIQSMLLRARNRQYVEARAKIDSTISGRLTPAPQRPAPVAPAPSQTEDESAEAEFQPGLLQTLFARLFHIRLEVNGVITYRKHWFILLINIWAPTLLLLGLFVVMVLRLFNYFDFISIIGTFALAFLLGLVVFIWWLYVYVDWRNDVYVVTNDEIVDVYKKPLGTETRKAAPIKNILSIEFRRLGFIGYLLNYGTVYVKVGETTFDFDYVYNPSEVQRELFQKLSEFKYREKLTEEQAEARRMADWIEGYHRWQQHGHP